MLNVVYDTNYTQLVPQGGFPYFDEKSLEPKEEVVATQTSATPADPHAPAIVPLKQSK